MTALLTKVKNKVQREKAEPILGQNRLVANLLGLLTWIVGLVFFFPLFWLVLNGFKEEIDANSSPKLFFDPTLDRFREVTEDTTGVLSFTEAFTNSIVIVTVSTILVLILAVPAAYAVAA